MKYLIKYLLFGLLAFSGHALFAQRTFKVLSYNILEGMKTDKTEGKQEFVSWLKLQDPDVFAIQEANGFTPKTLQELAESYGHKYSVLLKETGYPTAITSKHPIENAEKFTDKMTHGFIVAKILDYNFVVLHLNPHSYIKKRAEMKTVLDSIKTKNIGKKLLMMGDFNSYSPLYRDNFEDGIMQSSLRKRELTSNGKLKYLVDGEIDFEVQQAILDMGLVDVIYKLETENPTKAKSINPQKHKIDYIYCSKDIQSKIISGNFIQDNFTKTHSDHIPIVIELKK